MQTFSSLAERSNVLWQQRLSLCNSDYVSLSQLQRHDRQLLQSVRLCQRYLQPDDTEAPLWLAALLNNSAAELSKLLALPLALPAQVLLAELWLALQQKTPAHYAKQYSEAAHSQLLGLLATKPVAASVYQSMQLLDIRSAVQLAGQCGLTEQLTNLQPLLKGSTLDAAGQAELRYSLYLLGQRSDECELVAQLLSAACLTPRQLQVLLLAAPAGHKVRIVNALTMVDTGLAINAMGFSGLTKFCPLLLDIATEPTHRPAVQSALITMLGALSADSLQRGDQDALYQALLSCDEPIIAGQRLKQLNLSVLWASGNQYQRFAAAALRVLQQPGLPLAEPTNWQGGLWPTA